MIAANRVEAERSSIELQTALAKAERDLSFTEIRAPFDGIVANRAVEPGQYGSRRHPADGAGSGRWRLYRGQFQGNPAWPACMRAKRRKSPSMLSTAKYLKAGLESVAGLGLGIFPAAAGKCHGEFHQDHPARAREGFSSGGACRKTDAGAFGYGDGGYARRQPRSILMAATATISGVLQPPANAGFNKRHLAAFLFMVFGMFIAILDIQIVSSSLAEIQAGISASADEISWGQTSYLIAEVVMIPLRACCRAFFRPASCSPGRPSVSRS